MINHCYSHGLLPNRWPCNRVPAYATSIEGVHAAVLSPDETQLLLCFEYNRWDVVSRAELCEVTHSLPGMEAVGVQLMLERAR
jgi:hypothetical protein